MGGGRAHGEERAGESDQHGGGWRQTGMCTAQRRDEAAVPKGTGQAVQQAGHRETVRSRLSEARQGAGKGKREQVRRR